MFTSIYTPDRLARTIAINAPEVVRLFETRILNPIVGLGQITDLIAYCAISNDEMLATSTEYGERAIANRKILLELVQRNAAHFISIVSVTYPMDYSRYWFNDPEDAGHELVNLIQDCGLVQVLQDLPNAGDALMGVNARIELSGHNLYSAKKDQILGAEFAAGARTLLEQFKFDTKTTPYAHAILQLAAS